MIGYIELRCCRCNVIFFLPPDLHNTARRDETVWFYCPHGHRQHFSAGESEADKLRRERDRLKQQIARHRDVSRQWEEEAGRAKHQARAYKGQVTKLKRRAKAGLCPCCSRHFDNLERHIETKHPEMSTEPDNVVPIKAGSAS